MVKAERVANSNKDEPIPARLDTGVSYLIKMKIKNQNTCGSTPLCRLIEPKASPLDWKAGRRRFAKSIARSNKWSLYW